MNENWFITMFHKNQESSIIFSKLYKYQEYSNTNSHPATTLEQIPTKITLKIYCLDSLFIASVIIN